MTAAGARGPLFAGAAQRGAGRSAFFLFFSCVVLYSLNHQYLGSADTTPNVYLPFSIILHHDLYLDHFREPPKSDKEPLPYSLHLSRGHLISSYPVLPAVLAVPVALGPALWVKAKNIPYTSETFLDVCVFSAKLAAALITAGSVVLVFLTLARFVSRSTAWALAYLYALGTAAFPIASQALWGHGPAMLFLSAAAYVWLCRPDRLIALSVMLSLAVAARPVAALPALLFTAAVAWLQPRRLPRFLLAPALVAGLLLAYNLYFFGVPAGGYPGVNADMIARQQLGSLWTTAIGTGLAGLLISPSRGLLIFSPFVVAAFWGAVVTLRRAEWLRWRPLALSAIGQVLLFSCYSSWWGGMCYGPRLLSEICPFLMLLLVPVLPAIEATTARRAVFQVLAAASIFIQSAGAMLWTGDWYFEPTSVDTDRSRLWNWKDTEITRTLGNYHWSDKASGGSSLERPR